MTTLIPKFDLKNGGSTPVGAVNRPINEKLAEIVSVKDFGAKGDGTTDDTAALTAFFNAMTSNGSYYLPSGVYLTSGFSITKNALSNVTLYGNGATIKYTADQTSQTFALNFTNSSDIEIYGTTWDGNAYITSIFNFSSCQRINIHDNTFNRFWISTASGITSVYDGMAIYAEKSAQVNFCHNTFYRVNRGIDFDESNTTSVDVLIDDNNFYEMGFGCITTAQKNCVVSNNTMKYCSLGPFPRSWNTYTRTDMRNDAWVPIVNIASYYGGGHGPAINIGSGQDNSANGYYPYPENLLITNNTIDYAAEYGIGVECVRYQDTAPLFAGPGKNVTVSNNNVSNTGTQCLFLEGVQGLAIIGNNLKTAGLSGGGDPFILCVARGIASIYQSQPLSSRILNACVHVTIIGNNLVDTTGVTKLGVFMGPGNTQSGIGDVTFSHNNIIMSYTNADGIVINSTVITDYPAASRSLDKIHIVNNSFGMSTSTGFRWLNLDGCDLTNSTISCNRTDGFTASYWQNETFFDYVSGLGEAYLGGVSTTYNGDMSGELSAINTFPSGTVAAIGSKNVTSGTVTAALLSIRTQNVNGPTMGFIGGVGQGSSGNYLGTTIVTGGSNNNAGTSYTTYTTADATAFKPGTDNIISCGGSGARWSVVYAGTGTINTSDEREKQDIKDLSELERQVAVGIKGLIKSFRFKDAVSEKGDKARIHFGVMAQQVAEAFRIVGLNPDDYALFCYDEWEDDEITGIKAGNRYGIRYDELLAFVISAL